MDKELIRLLLCYSFWKENKHKILKEMISSSLHGIYKTINEAHEKFQKDLTVKEVKALYRASNPTLTIAQLELIDEALRDLPAEISDDVAKEVIKKAWITEIGRQIADLGIEAVNKGTLPIEKIKSLLTNVEQGRISEPDDLQQVSGELDDILKEIEVTTKWNFYLEPLRVLAKGIGPGLFVIIAARVETGKTASIVSLIAAPGGFAEQGAVVNCYFNEEPAQRTQGRMVMCWTGMNLQEILLDPDKARTSYNQIKDRIRLYECRGKGIEDIAQHVRRTNPDIIVIDMLDKLWIDGNFAREDERLGAIYARARTIGIDESCAVIGTSQLNADADGKMLVSSANLAGSRTSKAAEADLLIGIGKSQHHNDNGRVLNLIKNKITSHHEDIICKIIPQISRYVV